MFVPNQIGKVVIHTENQIAACEVLQVFSTHKVSPLLISEPQQGKTEVAIATAHGFIETCIRNNETYQVIVITNLSDNDLREQTKTRFEEADLIKPFSKYPPVEIYHHSDLKKIELKDVSKRLIILDECHIALGYNRPLHVFLKTGCGVEYGQSVGAWSDNRNYVLSISATPYATKMREELDKLVGNKQSFSTIRLKKSKAFFGIFELIDSGRPKQMRGVLSTDKKSLSDFTKECLDQFREDCIKYGNGYLFIRGKGKKLNKLKDYLKNNSFFYKEYSQDENNITSLSKDVGQEPSFPVVILIKNAMRAGKTLLSTKYIRGILESEESNPDAASQAICRSCGYATDDGHSKYDDKYPIYCDLKALYEAALFYDYDMKIPKGNNNTQSFEDQMEFEFICVDKREDVPSDITDSIGTISGNLEKDVAHAIITGRCPSAKSRAWLIDSPSLSSEFNGHQSWNSLITQFPAYQGKIVYAKEIGLKTNVFLSEDGIKEACVLHNPNNTPFIPKGINNKSNGALDNYEYQLQVEVCDSHTNAMNAFNKIYEKVKSIDSSIGHISTNDKDDLADRVRNIISNPLSNDPGVHRAIIYVDDYNTNFQNSWNQLIKDYPNYNGKYLVFSKFSNKSSTLTINAIESDQIKDSSLLYDKN